jgi:hypothetical protein
VTVADGPGEPLPYYERLQRLFGRHDLSAARAYYDAHAAAAEGARAYTRGHRVVFGGPPDLRLVAHEAAHVVQQRAGVAGNSEDCERHADAVAAKVADGQSAEALLDEKTAGGGGAHEVVQRKIGFEFETTWELYKTDRGHFRKVPSKDPASAHHGPGSRWRVESDNSHLEFILDPPVITLSSVRAIVGEMAAFAKQLQTNAQQGAVRRSGRFVDAGAVGWQSATPNLPLWIKPPQDPAAPIWADTQATIGVSLMKLESFLQFLARPQAVMNTQYGGQGRLPPAYPAVRDSRLVPYQVPDAHVRPDTDALALRQNDAATTNRLPLALDAVARMGDPVPQQMVQLRGFLTYVAFYLISAAANPRGRDGRPRDPYNYPKAMFALMDRSDFVRLFSKLNRREQTWFIEAIGFESGRELEQIQNRTPLPDDLPMAPPGKVVDRGTSPSATRGPAPDRLFGARGLLAQLHIDADRPMSPRGYGTPETWQDGDDTKAKISHGPTPNE